MQKAFRHTGIMSFVTASEEILQRFPEAGSARLTVKCESNPVDFRGVQKVGLYAGETRIAYAEGRSLLVCDSFMNGLRMAIYKQRRARRAA